MKHVKLIFILMTILFLAFPQHGLAKDTKNVGKIASISGTVDVQKSGGKKQFKAARNMSITQGDTISTGAKSNAVLHIDGDKEVTIAANTKLVIKQLVKSIKAEQGKTQLSLVGGKVKVKINKKLQGDSKFQVQTPNAIMGVMGTEFDVAYGNGQTTIAVHEGVVRVTPTSNASEEQYDVYPQQMVVVDSDDTTPPRQMTGADREFFNTDSDLSQEPAANEQNTSSSQSIQYGPATNIDDDDRSSGSESSGGGSSNTPAPSGPTEPGDTTEPSEPTEPGDGTDPNEPTEPGDTTEPSEPNEPGDVTDPNEPNEPGDTTEPSEPTEPGDTTEPNEPTEPGDGTEPDEPNEPSDVTDPREPNEPGDTTEPDEPTEPGDVTDPNEPNEPGDTTEPSEPTEPGDVTDPNEPTEPDDTTEPDEPTEPGDGTDPNEPTEPGDVTDPSEPTEPGDGTDPSEPTEPGDGTDPNEPNEPAEPGDIIDPNEPNEPGYPIDPTEPGITIDPDEPNKQKLGYAEGKAVKETYFIGVLTANGQYAAFGEVIEQNSEFSQAYWDGESIGMMEAYNYTGDPTEDYTGGYEIGYAESFVESYLYSYEMTHNEAPAFASYDFDDVILFYQYYNTVPSNSEFDVGFMEGLASVIQREFTASDEATQHYEETYNEAVAHLSSLSLDDIHTFGEEEGFISAMFMLGYEHGRGAGGDPGFAAGKVSTP